MKESITHTKSAFELFNELNTLLQEIKTNIHQDLSLRKEVVFLPYKASHWATLEPLWKTAMEDPTCDVYVVPIPWYYRNNDGTLQTECQYEGNLFPEYVPITSYQTYNLEKRHPYAIIFQNPYDHCNHSMSVDLSYYSSKLKSFSETLVYVPWFVTDEIISDNFENKKALYNTKYYVKVPGVINADIIIAQSPKMRDVYIDVLAEYLGISDKTELNKKVFSLDSSPSETSWQKLKLIIDQRKEQ